MAIILSKTTHGSFKIPSEMVFPVNMFCFGPKMGDKYWTNNYINDVALSISHIDDVALSIRSNEKRFRNVFYLFFHINLSL